MKKDKNSKTSKVEKKKTKFNPWHFALGLLVLFFLLGMYGVISSLDQQAITQTGKVVIFGMDIDIKGSSLLLASIIIGFLDGFNPCAMWVLIYLISMVSTLKDKRKLTLIVGTFVATEAIMYFLVLAGWLNLFMFIGISNIVLTIVGIFAIGMGVYTIKDYIEKKGKVECEIGDFESRKKTMNKIKDIVHSPITMGSILAIIFLAIVINSLEFVCSAGLPAVFTQMLAIADVSSGMKYFYITIYDFFFMIDDFIIFGLAYYAMNSPILDKYSSFSKIIGGIIMLIIGIILVFFPTILM